MVHHSPSRTHTPPSSMEYMANACSTTARRGALDWAPIFEKANTPIFEQLYESVKNGTETRKALEFNGRPTYRQDLAKELKEIDEQEIWRVGECSRILADRVSIDCMILQVRPYGRCGLITSPSECLD